MLRRSGLLTRIATERGSLCERMKSGLRFSNLNGSRARNCGYLHLPEQWLSLCLFRRHAQVHSNTARVYCGVLVEGALRKDLARVRTCWELL